MPWNETRRMNEKNESWVEGLPVKPERKIAGIGTSRMLW
jgi:hypothetical protein